MDRNNLHNEENFWPCVSDMFLALFVIALVLYSTMSAEKGRGDEYISELAEMEACSLVEFLKERYPNSDYLKKIDVEAVRLESGAVGSRPELTEMLYALLDCQELKVFFKTVPGPEERVDRYTEAILALYMATSESGTASPDEDALDYNNHVLMREVRERIERKILLKWNGIDRNMTDEEMLKELKLLRNLLARSVDKSEYDELKSEYDALKNRYDELAEAKKDVASIQEQLDAVRRQLADAQKEIEDLKRQVKYKDQTISDQADRIAGLDGQIKKMIDVRVNVMSQVKDLLTRKYESLVKAGVKVEAEKGIIVVPSSAFAFPQASANYYSLRKGILTSDLQKVLVDELEDSSHEENLKLLASFLKEIGKMVANGELQVDNIAIECHTDNDVSKIKYDKRFYNDGLSLQRAFDAWRLLDQYAGGKLASYRNAAGQGLFSMTGFGARVLPEKRNGEKTKTYEERCRRMQIRFNCLPVAGKENNSVSPAVPAVPVRAYGNDDDIGLRF